jgi:tetratricopeptide (TPR) repeat protein
MKKSSPTASETNSTYAPSLFDEIDSKIKEEKYIEAIDMLSKVISETSDPSYPLKLRAQVYMLYVRNYDKAIEDYTAYIQMKPKEGKAYFSRGKAHRKQEQYIEAIRDFSTAINLDPNDVAAYYNRSLCKYILDDMAGAISDCEAIIERLQPDSKPDGFLVAAAMHQKGYCLSEMSKYAEALLWINKALELDPNTGSILRSRGEVYYKQKKYKEAIQDINKSIQLDSDYATKQKDGKDGLIYGMPYYIRGMSKIEIGDKTGGCADLSKAGELGIGDAYKAMKEKCH